MPVVQIRRPVDAHAHTNAVTHEQIAPGVVDEYAIGLDGVRHLAAGTDDLCDRRNGLLIVIGRQHQPARLGFASKLAPTGRFRWLLSGP